MLSNFEQAREFNSKILKIGARPIALPTDDEASLTRHQLMEEADEYYEAKSAVDAVDALIDSLYFAYGALYKLGLNGTQVATCFAAVHNKNMEKAAGKVAKRDYGDAVDATKSSDWVGPEQQIAEILGVEYVTDDL